MRRCPADRKLEQRERAVELGYIGLDNMGGAFARPRLHEHKMQVFPSRRFGTGPVRQEPLRICAKE
jgi:hypothetical protein